ncbi:MAG: hypothetical protein LBU85_08610 [Treponema sp.]|jgi:hypothetical protein|nr:hypothetical protein [Treponema sp.]
MEENIITALQTIEDDYKICLKVIGRYYDYLETCGLKEFNKYSKYRWSYDRDRNKGGSYVCIRYGNSLIKKCLVKKRAYIENDDLYRWVRNKELVQEALDEAYQYIAEKISGVKGKIDEMKKTAQEYAEKLENISGETEEDETASKKISWEE